MRISQTFRLLVAASVLVGTAISIEALASPAGASSAHDRSSSQGDSGRSSSSGSAAGTTHTVRPGESVASIAARYGITADDLRAANGIVDDMLYAGGRLVIRPGAAGGAASQGNSTTRVGSGGSVTSGGTYTVRTGDSLWAIAQRHGISLRSLLSANGLRTTSVILPGRKLTIPGGQRSGSAGSTSTTPSSSRGAPSGATGDSSPSVLSAVKIVCPVPGASFMNDWGFPRSTTSGGFHQGNDLFAPAGTPVVAPLTGQLSFGSNKLGGKTFNITSPSGWVAYGAHNSSLVGSDRWVNAGEVIAYVGDSGDARGGPPHLHLGLRRSVGAWVNPYPSLSAAC